MCVYTKRLSCREKVTCMTLGPIHTIRRGFNSIVLGTKNDNQTWPVCFPPWLENGSQCHFWKKEKTFEKKLSKENTDKILSMSKATDLIHNDSV